MLTFQSDWQPLALCDRSMGDPLAQGRRTSIAVILRNEQQFTRTTSTRRNLPVDVEGQPAESHDVASSSLRE